MWPARLVQLYLVKTSCLIIRAMASIPCIIHPSSSDFMRHSYLLWIHVAFIQVQAWQACLKTTEVELIKLLILIKLYNNPHHINKITQNVIIIGDLPIHYGSIPNFFDECFISNCLVFKSIKIPQVLTKLFICQIIKNFAVKTRTGHINAHYWLVVLHKNYIEGHPYSSMVSL